MKYKIAFLLPHLESRGGVTVAVQTISKHLSSLGHDIHLFPIGNTNVSPTANIHPVNAKKRQQQIAVAKTHYANEEKNGSFDLVVSNTMPANEILYHLNVGKKHLIVLHQASLFTKKNIFTLLKRRITFPKLFHNKNLAMVSECLEKEFIKKYPYIHPNSTQTIYNALDEKHIKELSTQPAKLPDYDFILCLGRQTKNKNISMLLNALKQIKNKTIKLVLLGHGKETNRLKVLTKILNLESQVIFVEWANNPYPWIKHAKALISTSKSECLPLVHLEALLLKTPVISTDIKCGPSEILTDSLSQFLVPLNDTNMLARKIDEALINYPIIESKYTEKFTVHKISEQYLNFIQSLHKETKVKT